MTLFEVTTDDLGRMNPEQSVTLFRKLIWAEAITKGIPKNKIDVPSAITDDDGGVDANVSPTLDIDEGLIKKGLTCYQIKTGSFSLSSDASKEIKEFMFNKKEGKYILKPRVKDCFENNGTFVIVLFGSDRAEREPDQIVTTFKEKLEEECGDVYKDVKIEVFKQNQLVGFLEPYASLRLSILGTTGKFHFHDEWKEFGDMLQKYKQNDKLKEQLEKVQEELRNSSSPINIRVIGEPGSGKTRFVLETTDAEDLSPLVLYVEHPDDLHDGNFLTQCVRDKNSLILVVDECNSSTHKDIWNKVKCHSPPIKLITIFNEPDPAGSTVELIEPEELGDDEIAAILKDYDIPDDKISKWISFCKPSPRAAHIIGENLANDRSLLDSIDVTEVWDRYIAGRIEINSNEFKNRKTVLLWISLFKKFGYLEPFEEEGKFIAKKIEEVAGISYNDFTRIVKQLQSMKILQGRKTLYITPKILHIKLWTLWWERYGGTNTFTLDDLLIEEGGQRTKVSTSLIGWYGDMLKYAKESVDASLAIKKLLGQDGPFVKSNLLQTELGGSFFLAIVEADPDSSMYFLKNTVGQLTTEQLLKYDFGRRHVVWALESIAMRKHLFHDAARLLLKLGEAETETYANNASGVFKELFLLLPGKGSPTELPPKDRIPILLEALDSKSEPRVLLGLDACNTILETRHWTRIAGPERLGLRDDLNLWKPTSKKEYLDMYKTCLEILENRIDVYTGNTKEKLVNVILNRAREFFVISEFFETYLRIFKKLISLTEFKEKIVSSLIDVLHYEKEKLDKEKTEKLINLKNEVIGTSFHSLLERHVGMQIMLDKFDDSGKYSEDANKQEILKLVNTALDPEKLKPELAWLMTEKAKNAYEFGRELALKNTGFSLLSILIEEQKKVVENTSVLFLNGYFRGIYELDISRWETELERLSQGDLKKWVPEIASRTSLSDKVGELILSLIQNGVCDYTVLGYFKFGGTVLRLSSEIADKWFEYLLTVNEITATLTALDLFHSFYIHRKDKEIPLNFAVELLTHSTLIDTSTPISNTMIDYYWSETAKRVIEKSSEHGLKIAETVLRNFETDSFFGRYGSQTRESLDEITKKEPHKIWTIVSKYLGPPVDSRAFNIKNWLRGGHFEARRDIFEHVPFEEICEWVEEDKELRSRYLATFLKPDIASPNSLTRRFLVKYGDDDKVRLELLRNFFNEAWIGPASEHYERKKQEILKIKEKTLVLQ